MATGLSLSDTSNLEDMSAIVIADAIANIEPAGPTNQLVTKYPIQQGAKQINLPLWGRLSAAAITEGIDIAVPQQMSVTVRNLTAGEHGILTFVSDRLKRQNNENVLSEVGNMQGNAMGRLLESDLVTLFDSVSKSTPGAGNNMTFYHIAGATSYLRTDNNASFGPAPGKANAVLHPEQIRRLVQEVSTIQGGGTTGMAAQPIPTGLTEEVIENYFRGNEQIFGTRIWESGVVGRPAGTGDAKGCMFVPQAFALAMALEVEAEDERDISLRGTEIVMVAEWGESEVVDEWAVELHSAADVI